MNRLPIEKRAQIISLLTDGTSLGATSRIVGCSINTVTKLLLDVGEACAAYQDRTLRDLPCKTIEADEIWSFVYSKQRNVPEELKGQFGVGDVWTWTALDADTKLIVSWYVGGRQNEDAEAFMLDLSDRLTGRIQLTTDGHGSYPNAVGLAFRHNIDFAQLIKTFATDRSVGRYSPPICTGARVRVDRGNPDPARISTSYVERQNLTMRMGMRRFTRLTNGFSKKLDHHMAAIAIHFMHYNFARPHTTLSLPQDDCAAIKQTPAMAAGIADHIWTAEEIARLAD
ncbi:MAG TPA: IS1 family transposase [Solirubrobacteraceae bacterium]|nr:IS1 family transposase [Solirubrobacteraceae bacterium]